MLVPARVDEHRGGAVARFPRAQAQRFQRGRRDGEPLVRGVPDDVRPRQAEEPRRGGVADLTDVQVVDHDHAVRHLPEHRLRHAPVLLDLVGELGAFEGGRDLVCDRAQKLATLRCQRHRADRGDDDDAGRAVRCLHRRDGEAADQPRREALRFQLGCGVLDAEFDEGRQRHVLLDHLKRRARRPGREAGARRRGECAFLSCECDEGAVGPLEAEQLLGHAGQPAGRLARQLRDDRLHHMEVLRHLGQAGVRCGYAAREVAVRALERFAALTDGEAHVLHRLAQPAEFDGAAGGYGALQVVLLQATGRDEQGLHRAQCQPAEEPGGPRGEEYRDEHGAKDRAARLQYGLVDQLVVDGEVDVAQQRPGSVTVGGESDHVLAISEREVSG